MELARPRDGPGDLDHRCDAGHSRYFGCRYEFPWYTYSPTRVRYRYARGVLVEMYREAEARLGDPVAAWAEITGDAGRRRRYQSARGKGGHVRVSWDEAVEIVAAAHVHTISTYGSDRVAGYCPIPSGSPPWCSKAHLPALLH